MFVKTFLRVLMELYGEHSALRKKLSVTYRNIFKGVIFLFVKVKFAFKTRKREVIIAEKILNAWNVLGYGISGLVGSGKR